MRKKEPPTIDTAMQTQIKLIHNTIHNILMFHRM